MDLETLDPFSIARPQQCEKKSGGEEQRVFLRKWITRCSKNTEAHSPTLSRDGGGGEDRNFITTLRAASLFMNPL